MRYLRRSLALLAAASVVAAVAAPGAQARPAYREYAGINIQKLIFNFHPGYRLAHFNAMEEAGIRLVRFDALWQVLEPEPPQDGRHTYYWGRFDGIVGELAKRGIRWLPAVEYSAKWAATTTAHYAAPPRDPADYAEFAAAVARRYGRGGSFWRQNPEIPALPVTDYELWNEPNISAFFYPEPNPAHYADMYLAARAAIRKVDPEADAWVGGLVGDRGAVDFVRRMYAARPALRGNVDAVALHPYAANAGDSLKLVRQLRVALDELGEHDAAIPITEIGWPTSGHWSIPDATRADYIAALAYVFANSDCGVWTFMPHTWTTQEENPLLRGEWFGLWGPSNAQPNATGRAYRDMLAELDPGPVTRAVCGRMDTGG